MGVGGQVIIWQMLEPGVINKSISMRMVDI